MSQKKRVPVANSRREAARREQEQRRRYSRLTIVGSVAAVVLVVGAMVASVIISNQREDGSSASQATGTDAPTTAAGDTAKDEVNSTSNSVGKTFPDFVLTTPDGKQVTRASLTGKPSLIWFTVGTCIPCQEGAPKVSKVDDETGGKALNVLVVFVDPQEPPSALTKWRETYARPDWTVALDAQTKLSSQVKLQYLDTKFLLDERGKILNVDIQPVTDNYLQIVRDTAKA